MPDLFPRWLSPEQTASYIGERVDRLPRLLRAGKLPAPSYHLGPRCPRYDREALDRLFLGAATYTSAEQIEQDAINGIIRDARARRAAALGRRHRQGISV